MDVTDDPVPALAPVNDETAAERVDDLLEDPTGRLARYTAATRTPLDLLALLTIWIVVVPPGDFGRWSTAALVTRVAVSVVYAVDISLRTLLARRHVHYLLHHLVGVAAVAFPFIRVLFSLRLLHSIFRRGSLVRLLVAATVLVLDGAAIVYLFEHGARGANIHTFGEAVWWAMVTVTTVGYGDYTPVTVEGRIVAVFVMMVGLLTLAVVTAQVASTFVDQSRQQSAAGPDPDTDPDPGPDGSPDPGAGAADAPALHRRIEQLEAALAANTAVLQRLVEASGGTPPP